MFFRFILLTTLLVTSPSFAFQKAQQAPQQSQVKQDSKNDVYACPMHPHVQGEKGDNCPICEMALVPEEKMQDPTYKHHHH